MITQEKHKLCIILTHLTRKNQYARIGQHLGPIWRQQSVGHNGWGRGIAAGAAALLLPDGDERLHNIANINLKKKVGRSFENLG